LINHDCYNMPAPNQHMLFELLSAICNVFRLALKAFQTNVSGWDSAYLVGVPTYQGLLKSWNQSHQETSAAEGFLVDMNPVHAETHRLNGKQRIVELKPALLLASENRGNVRLFTTHEMRECYRVASSQSSLPSKEMQN
jgi:hypothetical protein